MPDSGLKQRQFISENNFLPALHSFPAKGTYSELGSGSPSLQGSAWHKALHIPIAPINRTDTIVRVGCTRTLLFYDHYNQSKFIKVAFTVPITCFLSVSKSGCVLAGCHPEPWVPLGEVLPFSFFLYNLHLHGILGSYALFSRALSNVSDICGSFFPSYSHQRELYLIVIRPSVMVRWCGLLAEALARNSSPLSHTCVKAI